MLVIGIAEIVLISIIAIGGLLMAVALTRARRVAKHGTTPNYAATAEPASAGYDSLRARIERQYRRRYELAAHIVIFLFMLVGLGLLRVPPSALALLGGTWALVLIVHGLQVIFAETTDRAIERAIESEQGTAGSADKPKRNGHVRLSDDGEVLDVIDDEWETDDKQKRA